DETQMADGQRAAIQCVQAEEPQRESDQQHSGVGERVQGQAMGDFHRGIVGTIRRDTMAADHNSRLCVGEVLIAGTGAEYPPAILEQTNLKMTDHFKFIPDPGFGPDEIPTGHLICNRCGRRVETGIMNVSSHWRDCYPEEYKKILRMRRPGRHWDRSPVIIHLNGKTYLYDKDMDDMNRKYDE